MIIMEKMEQFNNSDETAKQEQPPLSLKEEIKLDKEISSLAKIYTNLGTDKIESGINYLLAETEKVSLKKQDYHPSEYLKGMLNLESYNRLKNEQSPEKIKKAEECLEKSFMSFEKAVFKTDKKTEQGNFAILIKNEEKNDVLFGNLPLAMSYLGDIYARKSLEQQKDGDKNKKEEYWAKGISLYEEAIKKEKVSGVKSEIKTILGLRNIIKELGNEKSIWCEKTTRRSDLRHKAADLMIQYKDKSSGKNSSVFIDITEKSTTEKDNKKQYSETAVLDLSDGYDKVINLADYELAKTLETAKKEIENTGGYSKETAEKTQKAFKEISKLCQELASDLKLTGARAKIFRKDFFINNEKVDKLTPNKDRKGNKVDPEKFIEALLVTI